MLGKFLFVIDTLHSVQNYKNCVCTVLIQLRELDIFIFVAYAEKKKNEV